MLPSCHLAFMYQMPVMNSSQPALYSRRSTCQLAHLPLDMYLAGAGKHALDFSHWNRLCCVSNPDKCCYLTRSLPSILQTCVTATEAGRCASKAENAFNLALNYFRSVDDVYHQVRRRRLLDCCPAALRCDRWVLISRSRVIIPACPVTFTWE